MHWVKALASSIGPSSREDARLSHSAHVANVGARATNVAEPAANMVRGRRQDILLWLFPSSGVDGIISEFFRPLCLVHFVLHLQPRTFHMSIT